MVADAKGLGLLHFDVTAWITPTGIAGYCKTRASCRDVTRILHMNLGTEHKFDES